MTSHLRYIADVEKIAIADDALTLVAQIANGGLRDAESLLDQLSLLPETITVEKVWDLVGAVPEQDLLKLLQAIKNNDSIAVLQQCRSLLDRGREPLVVLQNLASFYLNLLIAKTAPQHSELTAVTEICWQQLCAEGKNWPTALILRGQQHLKEAETQLKRTTQPRLWLEVTLLGLLPEAHGAIPQGRRSLIAMPPQTIPSMSVNPVVTTVSPAVESTIPPAVPRETTPQAAMAIKPDRIPASTASQPNVPNVPNVAQHNPRPTNQPTTVVNPLPTVVSEPVTPNNGQDRVTNQEIWSKVVSCLQPPTTQALLKQQCHLVSFDGLSAIVGISSAKLQKLNQGKVPNIEAAFAQVCQRKVRVQLEVAGSQSNMAKK
ncbi:MAG: polymerase subunit gamma/tau, partial [Cyanobacteriota bacterium]